jgi:hypothetical protein
VDRPARRVERGREVAVTQPGAEPCDAGRVVDLDIRWEIFDRNELDPVGEVVERVPRTESPNTRSGCHVILHLADRGRMMHCRSAEFVVT